MTELVVVVCDRGRLRDTVSYALREGRDAGRERPVAVRVLVPVGPGADGLARPAAEALVGRVRTVVDDERPAMAVAVGLVPVSGSDSTARARTLVDAFPADAAGVVLMPDLREFDAATVAAALDARGRGDVSVERAPVGRRIVRPPVALARTPRRVAATFALSLAFYLVLGDPTSPFDLITGVASAGIVAAVLSRVTFETEPSRATPGRLLRATVFLPYLLYAVVRANVAMAAVVLHPRLPIDPAVVRVPAPPGRLERALLANAITLTPGTLTVDVVDDELVVHTLTAASRADLEAGTLAAAVSFVVDGRRRPPATAPAGGR